MGYIPEWLWILIVGGALVGLIKLVFSSLSGRVTKLEEWKEQRPSVAEVLTFTKHYDLCKANTKELKDFIKEELIEVKKEIRKNGRFD
jgi:hypothetical protein